MIPITGFLSVAQARAAIRQADRVMGYVVATKHTGVRVRIPKIDARYALEGLDGSEETLMQWVREVDGSLVLYVN